MKKPTALQVALILVAGLGLGMVLLSILAVGKVYDTLVWQHARAYRRWEANKPYHYRYNLSFLGDMTYQDYQVEVTGGNLVRLTDSNTGVSASIPGSVSSSFLPTNAWISSNLLIDDLFIRIRGAIHPPGSINAWISRTNPALYNRLTLSGWIPPGPPTCDTAYPQANYDPVFGYPENLVLPANPCSVDVESSTRVHIKIDGFQVLP